jgi:hypothetical protein
MFAGDVTTMTTNLNKAVTDGITAVASAKAKEMPVALDTSEIQDTAVGGCPHPNDAGHKKLAGVLSATYAGM